MSRKAALRAVLLPALALLVVGLPAQTFTSAQARAPRGDTAPSTDDPPLPVLASRLPRPATPVAGRVVVSYGQPRQVVEGFGFSTAWASLPGGEDNLDAFFSVSKGAGFSILRNRIPFRESPEADDGFMAKHNGAYVFSTVSDEQGEFKQFPLNWDNWDLAATRGLLAKVKANPDYRLDKVFSTPWTPPNNAVDRWKRPTDAASLSKHRLTEERYGPRPEVGGSLDPRRYQDYADVLADYVLGFRSKMGVDLYALSIQNEPGYDVDYESCDWTGPEFRDFLIVLDRQFARKGVWAKVPKLRIMAPEGNNFDDVLLAESYAAPAARAVVDIAAGHQYEYGPWSIEGGLANLFTDKDRYQPDTFAASVAQGKQVWMTEWNLSAFESVSPLTQALVLARAVHQDFTRSGLNAFVFWWSASLLDAGKPTKSLWSLAQYSRFVRPGWRVIPVTSGAADGVVVTAFSNPATRALVMVAVNTGSEPRTILLEIEGARGFGTLGLHRTSATEDMAAVGSVPVDGPVQAVELAASSISTFTTTVTR